MEKKRGPFPILNCLNSYNQPCSPWPLLWASNFAKHSKVVQTMPLGWGRAAIRRYLHPATGFHTFVLQSFNVKNSFCQELKTMYSSFFLFPFFSFFLSFPPSLIHSFICSFAPLFVRSFLKISSHEYGYCLIQVQSHPLAAVIESSLTCKMFCFLKKISAYSKISLLL